MPTVEDLQAQGKVERVRRDLGAAEAMLDEAERHLVSAERIGADDPNGAYQLLYDGLRKAVTAVMAAQGLRVTTRQGAHVVVGELGAAFGIVDVDDFDRIRRTRNRSEYELAYLGQDEISSELETARLVAAAARTAIAAG